MNTPSKLTQRLRKYMRRLRYFVRSVKPGPMPKPDNDEIIDVVIPIVAKDLDTLPLCIEGVRRCVANKIGEIYIVAPADESIKTAAKELGLVFVDETQVLGYGAKRLKVTTTNGIDRSGWIYQQLLKLSGNVGSHKNFLVIDADHILLKPHVFIDADRRHIFYMSREYNYPYYENMSRVSGVSREDALSYVAHKMIFNKDLLQQLKAKIEHDNQQYGMHWDEIIVNSLDLSTQSAFSEYETYGHFVPVECKHTLPWRQKTLRKNSTRLPSYDELSSRYGKKFLSVTFPDYMKEK